MISINTNMITSKIFRKTENRKGKAHLIFYLLSLIFLHALPASAVKKFDVNPINLAVILTEQPDSARIADVCEYYGYINQPSQDGYEVYLHPNGSIIRYMYIDGEDGKRYPTIEVKSNTTKKEKDHILKQLNFKQRGSSYERTSIGYQTRCSSATGGYLRFSNHPKPRQQ